MNCSFKQSSTFWICHIWSLYQQHIVPQFCLHTCVQPKSVVQQQALKWLRAFSPHMWYPPGAFDVRSLTHTGRDVVQACLQGAAPLFCVVCDIGLQEGHTKLSLVHHAYQAASGPARSLSFSLANRRKSCEFTFNWIIVIIHNIINFWILSWHIYIKCSINAVIIPIAPIQKCPFGVCTVCFGK